MGKQKLRADPADRDGNVVALAGRRLRRRWPARPGPLDRARLAAALWRAGFFGLLGLTVLAVGGWAVLNSSLLSVRHVRVTGDSPLVSAAQVRRAAGLRPGTPLAKVDTAAVARRVERIAVIASARVSRSWPDTIVISVRDRVPALAVASAGRYRLIDGAGVTVRWAKLVPAQMPVLTSPPAVLRGNQGIRAAVAVLRELPAKLGKLVKSVSAPSADAVTLRLAGGITVVWGGPGRTAVKARELALLMRKHAIYYDVSDPNTVVTQG